MRSMCSMKCLYAFLLILVSIWTGNGVRQLVFVRNTAMEIVAGTVCCFDADFQKVANWADKLLLCNVLHKAILVRRSFRTCSGRTEDTVVLVEAVCRSQA